MTGFSAPTGLALRTDLDSGAEVDRGRGVHADPGMAVIVIVGVEEPVAERAGIGQTAEPLGEIGHVLESFEPGLGERVAFEQCGREWERRTPRSIISSETGFEVIEPPRSA